MFFPLFFIYQMSAQEWKLGIISINESSHKGNTNF